MAGPISVGEHKAEVIDRHGVVTDVQVWSETHVKGSGGGSSGFISGGQGHVSGGSISISSDVRNRFRVFIRDQDGKEEARDVGDNFPMRAGHRVLYRYVRYQEKSSLALFRNFDTGQEWLSPDRLRVKRISGFAAAFRWGALIGSACMLALGLTLFVNYGRPPEREPMAMLGLSAMWVSVGGLVLGTVFGSIWALLRPVSKTDRKAEAFEAAVRKAIRA